MCIGIYVKRDVGRQAREHVGVFRPPVVHHFRLLYGEFVFCPREVAKQPR